jgi:hypothetical protein
MLSLQSLHYARAIPLEIRSRCDCCLICFCARTDSCVFLYSIINLCACMCAWISVSTSKFKPMLRELILMILQYNRFHLCGRLEAGWQPGDGPRATSSHPQPGHVLPRRRIPHRTYREVASRYCNEAQYIHICICKIVHLYIHTYIHRYKSYLHFYLLL